MTTYTITAPNGQTYEIEGPEGASQEQVAQAVLARNPEAAQPRPTTPMGNTSGFVPAVKAGFQEMYGQGALALGKLGAIDDETAQRVYAEQQAKARQTFTPTQEGWTEAPLQKFKETLGGSLPYMAAPLAAGAGAVAAAPALGLGAVGAGVLGAAAGFGVSGAQFTGANLGRQAQEGTKYEDLSIENAALAAIPQAALDTISMRMIPGLGKLLGAAGKEVTEASARAIAEQTLKQAAVAYAQQTGKTMGVEGLTEAAQQVFERLQAGLSITDAKARAEYIDSAIGGAVVGGTLSPAGQFVDRRGEVAQGVQLEAQRTEKENAEKLRQQQFAAIDANKAAAEQKALDEQRNVAAATAAEDAGESVRTPQMIRQLERAHQARATALSAAGEAARNGDIEGIAEARKEAAQQAEIIRTLTVGKTDVEPPPPTPRGVPLEEMEKELLTLQGSVNRKGNPVPGKIEKALRSGEDDVADAYIARLQELKQQIAEFKGTAAEMEQRGQDLRAAQPTPETPNPYADYADTLEQRQQENILLRQEAGVDAEARQMAAARMDTSRTEQLSLMDDLKPKTTVVRDNSMKESIKDLQDALQAAKDTGNKEAEQDARDRLAAVVKQGYNTPPKPQGFLATRVADTRPAATETTFSKDATEESLRAQIARLPEKLDPASEALVARVHENLGAVAANPERRAMVADWLYGLQTGRATRPAADSGVADNFRGRDIEAVLDTLEQGKRSETEGNVAVVQKDMFPQEQYQGKLFPTPEAFNNFLGGEALQKMRVLGGQAGQTISRALKSLIPFQQRTAELSANVERLAQSADWEGQNQAAARARLGSVIARMQNELMPLREARVSAHEALNEAAQHSLDIGQMIEANMRKMDPDDGVGARLVAAANAAKNTMQQEVSKQNWDAARAAHKEVISALEAFRSREAQLTTDPNVLAFLYKDLLSQERLRRELNNVSELQSRYDAADTALQKAKKTQAGRRADKEDLRDARSAVGEADRVAAETANELGDARDAQRRSQDSLDTITKLTLDPIIERRDARRGTALPENQTDREAADGVVRRAEQDALEKADQGYGTPGERISFEARRRAQEVVDASAERKEQLQQLVVDPTLSEASRKKYQTELTKLQRAEAFLQADADRTDLVEQHRQKYTSLTTTTIPEQRAIINNPASTPKQVQKARERITSASKEAARLQTLMQMRTVERTPIQDRAEQQLQAESYLREDRAMTMAERGTLGE